MILFSLSLVTLAGLTARIDDPPLPPERTGLLYVSGYGSDNVGEYLPDGTLVRTFGDPGMKLPRGVAVDAHGNVVVVCQGSQRIQVFDLEGAILAEVTHPDLTSGTGIARSAAGNWYVGNFTPGRVLVFDRDWKHRATIEVGGMDAVNCVSFDKGGGFAVTDASNQAVHLFDAAHQHVGVVTHSSLGSPMSIAMDSKGDHYVSNGGSGVITKFDAGWNFVTTFGAGTLKSPQAVAIDEYDVLTITNFSADEVHRYDTAGQLLSSFVLTGVTTGRNAAWQVSPYALARQGSVNSANGFPPRVLTVNGRKGDALGRITLSMTDPVQVDIAASPSGPNPAPLVLYGFAGEPTLDSVVELPFGDGLFAFAPPFAGGTGVTLVNSVGREDTFGAGRFPEVEAPGTLLSFPGGVGRPMTLTLQAILEDAGSTGTERYSATNALVIEFR